MPITTAQITAADLAFAANVIATHARLGDPRLTLMTGEAWQTAHPSTLLPVGTQLVAGCPAMNGAILCATTPQAVDALLDAVTEIDADGERVIPRVVARLQALYGADAITLVG